ncbi:DUF4145 domain-containing protein [Nocardioides nanhaiensis]|uniref:DUF4145 domain-containing protein n=1 Tax=Nocardioides nanhaiensis TaxID=1476871 RepID=A0ABP8X172_9ACTN
MTIDVENQRGYCGHCEQPSGFTARRVETIHPSSGYGGRLQPNDVQPTATIEHLLECTYCKDLTLVVERRRWDMATNEVVDRVTVVYPKPPPRPVHPSVPTLVASLFSEGAEAEAAGLLRGASMLYRSCVEAMAKERSAEGRDLYQRIEAMKSTKALEADLADAMHEARLLGNDTTHDGIAYSAEEVADVAELVSEALHLIYVQPAERARFKQLRQARRDSARRGGAARP